MGKRARLQAERAEGEARARRDRMARVQVSDDVWSAFRANLGATPVSVALGELVRREVGRRERRTASVEQIASEFQLTSQTIRNWIKSGALSAVKVGHVYRVRREDVDAMMRRHQGETAPLGTHRDLWAPETLGMPYRRHEDRRQPSIWDGTSSSIVPSKRS